MSDKRVPPAPIGELTFEHFLCSLCWGSGVEDGASSKEAQNAKKSFPNCVYCCGTGSAPVPWSDL